VPALRSPPVKVRKHLGWANAVLLALLIPRERRKVGPVTFRATRLPQGGGRALATWKKGWKTYDHQAFGDEDIRCAKRLGYITVEPNDRARGWKMVKGVAIDDPEGFVWGKQCIIRLSTTELGRASLAAYQLRSDAARHPETYTP
jgi:hypothetical protein